MPNEYTATIAGRARARLALAHLLRDLLDAGYSVNVFAAAGNGHTLGQEFAGAETDEHFGVKIATDHVRREDLAAIAKIASVYGLEPVVFRGGDIQLREILSDPPIRSVDLSSR